MTRFEWDPAKSIENLRKHAVRFETAVLVFEDPWILSRKDSLHGEDEERYNALGEVAPGVILFVVYSWREEEEEEEIIRLISARKASTHERRTYEEAQRRAEKGHRRRGRQDRRYD